MNFLGGEEVGEGFSQGFPRGAPMGEVGASFVFEVAEIFAAALPVFGVAYVADGENSGHGFD